ncbi:MAG: MFS transporter [Gammaproteobacteria bacterium]|nr:MFS transporter [Gammaproteobacteria bacterium]
MISRGYARWVLALLTVVYMVSFIDRQILAMLVEPIRTEFGVSDTAMGFLTGFAFVVFYTAAGIPIARLADRVSRKAIIACALALWSAMTAASGFARSFAELAWLRVLVGVGEAGGNAPSQSLIADYFPPERRATALSIYAWGVYIGSGIAFLAGGWLVANYDWRSALLVAGLPGLALAGLVALTVRELPRGYAEERAAATSGVPLGEVLRYLARRRAFVLVVAGTSLQSMAGYGVLTWGPTFFARVHAWSWTEIGFTLGWIVLLGGCFGAFSGGWLADRLGARDQRWYARLPALELGLAVPFLAGYTLAPDASAAVWFLVPCYTLGAMYVGPMFAMVQGLAELRMRATAVAILLFFTNMVGLGLGPLAVGLLNDFVFGPQHGAQAIRYSMLVVGLFGCIASLCFWRAAAHLPHELAR